MLEAFVAKVICRLGPVIQVKDGGMQQLDEKYPIEEKFGKPALGMLQEKNAAGL